jgi:hypothetical protein
MVCRVPNAGVRGYPGARFQKPATPIPLTLNASSQRVRRLDPLMPERMNPDVGCSTMTALIHLGPAREPAPDCRGERPISEWGFIDAGALLLRCRNLSVRLAGLTMPGEGVLWMRCRPSPDSGAAR